MSWQRLVAIELSVTLIAGSAYLALSGYWLAWISGVIAYWIGGAVLLLGQSHERVNQAGNDSRARANPEQ